MYSCILSLHSLVKEPYSSEGPSAMAHLTSAALDALAALAGVKSGLHVNSLRMRSMMAGLTLSLS